MRQHGGRFRGLKERVRRGGQGKRSERRRHCGVDADELCGGDYRGQRSFGLSLDQFLAKRGASTIVARGRALKQSQAALSASIQQHYGVPPGPLIAIWGMETGFGSQRGNQNMLSAVATLAYDCRRPAFPPRLIWLEIQPSGGNVGGKWRVPVTVSPFSAQGCPNLASQHSGLRSRSCEEVSSARRPRNDLSHWTKPFSLSAKTG